jgi:uncharacterized membrane protein
VRLLGLVSAGLGTAQAIAPAEVNRLIGVRPTPATNAVMRTVGLQELAMAGGLLTGPGNGRPGPGAARLLWARALADMTHVTMLARAPRTGGEGSRRVTAAAGVAAGAAVLDLVGAARSGRGPRPARGRLGARSTITVNRPPAEVYRYWRDLPNLPTFMHHLRSVRNIDGNRSHWVARAPAGRHVEWDAEIVDELPDRLIAWRSVEGSGIRNEGSVRFAPAPKGAGTEVTVELAYGLPGGRAGAVVARLFGEEPRQQIKDDLRRFKQVVETGEVVRSDGSPEGTLTHRQFRQLAARPGG